MCLRGSYVRHALSLLAFRTLKAAEKNKEEAIKTAVQKKSRSDWLDLLLQLHFFDSWSHESG